MTVRTSPSSNAAAAAALEAAVAARNAAAAADPEVASSADPESQQQPQMMTATLFGAPADRCSMLEVVNVLASFRENHERLKLFRVSLSVIRFLSVLNFVYTVLGVTFLMLALCTEWTPEFNDYQRNQFFRIGLTVSVFAPLASFVDLLALRGLQLWRRAYLLPWLFLYAFAVSLIFANSLAGVFHNGFKWTYLVLMLCAFCLYSAWRHVRRQYNEMSRERPTCRTIEELASDLRSAAAGAAASNQVGPVSCAAAAAAMNDLPPKYEDLDQPPEYCEADGGGDAAAGGAAAAADPSSEVMTSASSASSTSVLLNEDETSSSRADSNRGEPAK